MKYQWHGKEVGVRFGHYVTKPNTDKPLFWYNFECDVMPTNAHDGSVHLDAIEVTYTEDGGIVQVFCIANHFGIGVHKLRNGGWPSHRHFSFSGGRFVEFDNGLAPKRFDEKGFAAYEAWRDAWMRKADPSEYERMESLRKLIRKGATRRPA